MTDASTFGGQLDPGTTFGASFGGNSPQGADVTPAATAPTDLSPPAADPAAPSQGGGGLFGSGTLAKILPGPNYTAPDPQASALDQTADTLQQRIKRANSIGSNPVLQFLDPEAAARARDFVPKATEQLQKIQQQKAAIAAGRMEAETLGLAPGETSDEATQQDRVAVAQSKALKGDLKAFQGLAAVKPEAAAAIQDQVHEAVKGHINNAQLAFDSLAGMQNAGQYDAKLKQLRADGTLTDLEALGMQVPKDFDTFNQVKGREGQALRTARQASENLNAQLEARANGEVMEKKEAEGYNGRLTTSYGDTLGNGTWSRINGKRAFTVNGQADVNDLGKKFTYATPEQRKAILEDSQKSIPKEEIEKARQFNRTYQLATTDAKGNKLPAEAINTNPNVQQGIAEGLASMLRGGNGGANVGLLKIETNKRGFLQGLVDKVGTEKAALINELKGVDVSPYLSKLTQSQMRDVMDAVKQYNDISASSRLEPIAKRAGALGLDATALGLGKGEVKGVEDQLEAGRQDTIARFKDRSRPTSSGDGAIYLDTPPSLLVHKPDATTPAPVPPPVSLAVPPTVPAGQAPSGGSPPSPVDNQPPQTGGGQPIQVAGQSVNVPLPAGASPAFVPSLQRIESGNSKDPWSATTPGSSASGAFQMIDKTWNDNKPADATATRAKDATPAQQSQAFATLIAKNAKTLTAASLPVNDTSLYVAHNLGATGASTLLKADPNADARTVVGETAAKNNPLFFRGKPTVATVLQRYQTEMNKEPPKLSGETEAPQGGLMQRLKDAVTGKQLGETDQQTFSRESGRTNAAIKESADLGVEHAPVIAGTVGGLTGGPVGGGIGAGAGQTFKDWMQGRSFDPVETAKQTALGGILSVGSAARPVLSAGARALGAGGVEAGAEAAKGGDTGDVVNAGAKGASEGLFGEAFGRALGMVGHKVFSMFAPGAKVAVQAAASKYADAQKVLDSEPNRLPGVGTAAGGPNPKYAAAEQAKDEAETVLKDAGLKPEEAAYAHKVASEGVPKQEAQAARPGATEKESIGQGYGQLENEVGAAGKGAVKETAKPLQDGPITAVVSGQVPKSFSDIAQKTEAAITAPAPDWRTKWNQLKDARSALLDKEREALGSTSDRKGETAEAYRALADTVRAQQEKTANYVFGPKDGPAFMARLKVLDGRYRTLMEATNGGDLEGLARLKGDAGRKADKAFRAFAMGDKEAVAAWDAMRRTGSNVEKDVLQVISAEKIPVLGKLISGAKLLTGFKDFIRERAAGSPASFSDMVPELKAAQKRQGQAVRDVGGQIGGHVTTQENMFGGAFQ